MPVHNLPIARRTGKFMRAWLTALNAMTWLAAFVHSGAMADEPAPVDLASKVRSIFERNCLKCHGPEKQRGGLRLDVRESVLAGEWDAHNDLKGNHGQRCLKTDRPIAGLLCDLKQRGLLESTLVVWGGEFGRMPVSEKGDGRDHNPNGFLVWMAGGGVKGGASHGETDEIGWKAASETTSVHDLHATILHLLGVDHKRLTYQHNGRRFRLTDTEGEVIAKLMP